jgi:hypothetical protein
MTVAELIEELKQMPLYMQVYTDVAKLDDEAMKVHAVILDRVKCKQCLSPHLGGQPEEEFPVVVLEIY